LDRGRGEGSEVWRHTRSDPAEFKTVICHEGRIILVKYHVIDRFLTVVAPGTGFIGVRLYLISWARTGPSGSWPKSTKKSGLRVRPPVSVSTSRHTRKEPLLKHIECTASTP